VLLAALAPACGSPKTQDSPISVDTSTASPAGSEGATMSTLDKAARMRFEDYHPDRVIEAVNALQPQGKQKSLDLIKSYLDRRDAGNDALGLFWVLRVLFEVPPGQGFPPVRLGQPDVSSPPSPDALPRFPIVIAHDVPLLVTRGYALGGFPEPVEAHLTYFQTHGTVRNAPLAPPGSRDEVADEFARLWKAAYGKAPPDVRELIGSQLARMQH
jgi:hypothetical protein